MNIQTPQNSVNKVKPPCFKGIERARAIVKSMPDYGEIVLYELDKKDIPFLMDMLKNIRLEKLAPKKGNLSQKNEWKYLIKKAAGGLKRAENVYLTAYKNKPCGIMSFMPFFDNELCYVSYTATWPYKTGENVKCAGQVLFRHVFEYAKSVKKGVCLVLDDKAPDGKKSNKVFYRKLGFEKVDQPKPELKILPNKQTKGVIKDILDTVIDYRPSGDGKELRLEKVLDINY